MAGLSDSRVYACRSQVTVRESKSEDGQDTDSDKWPLPGDDKEKRQNDRLH